MQHSVLLGHCFFHEGCGLQEQKFWSFHQRAAGDLHLPAVPTQQGVLGQQRQQLLLFLVGFWERSVSVSLVLQKSILRAQVLLKHRKLY